LIRIGQLRHRRGYFRKTGKAILFYLNERIKALEAKIGALEG